LAAATAWTVIGSTFLWSLNALADGIERPQRAAVAPPDFPELLGGEEEPVVEVAVVKPEIVREQRDCITFERAAIEVGKFENLQIADIDAFIRDMQRDLGDEDWCGGVRETLKIALGDQPDDPEDPEYPDPEDPGDPDDPTDPPVGPPNPGGGNPPGGGGGPGYAGARSF